MGKFESFRGRFLRYNGGEEHVFHGLHLDRWSYFEALSILKEEFKYDGAMKLWWKPKRVRMDRDLRPFVSDNDTLQLCACAETKKKEVQIYVEHVVSTTEPIEVIEWTQNAGEGGSEEELDVVVASVDCRDGGKGDARVEKEDIGNKGDARVEKKDIGNKGDARLEDEATVKQVGVVDLRDARVEDEATVKQVRVIDLGDARVEDEGILEGVDVFKKGDASHRDAENEDVAGMDDQSDMDDSVIEELDESEEERHRDDDDCFLSTNKSRRDIRKLLERWKKFSKEKRKRKPFASAGVGAFKIDSIGQNDIDATYSTDELDSDVECEGESVHKYTTFQSDDMCFLHHLSLFQGGQRN